MKGLSSRLIRAIGYEESELASLGVTGVECTTPGCSDSLDFITDWPMETLLGGFVRVVKWGRFE